MSICQFNSSRFKLGICFSVALLAWASIASAAEPSRFTAGKSNSAQLRFIEGLPVVSVAGTPEQMGQDLGTLIKKPLNELLGKKDAVARGFGMTKSIDVLMKTARLAAVSFPDSQRRELAAMAKSSGMDLDTLMFGNIVYEISHFPACSTLAVEPARSKESGPLFGRNLDFPTFGFLDQYSYILVERPEGKHAFVSMTFPSVVGVFSGMNDAGLCVAQLEVDQSADNAARVNLLGTPVAMCFRRLLEECTTVDEAEKLLRQQNRMMMCNLAVCDRQSAAVLEITPKIVARRPAKNGLCPCTNHFRTPELALAHEKQCSRYASLLESEEIPVLGISDVAKLLDKANQGQFTIQTMIFEPAALKTHVSFGPPPSSSQPLKTIDLAELLKGTD